MSTWGWIVVAIALLIAVAAVAWAVASRERSKRLRQRFGSEYERTVERTGNKREAEIDLRDRARQRDRLEIRPLSRVACDRYANEWRIVQQRFVDHPVQAVVDADSLLTTVMRERGYPVDDFEAQADVVSVDHPSVVENYRRAHTVFERTRANRASTEDLREALVWYRSLFDELLVTDDQDTATARHSTRGAAR